MVTTSMYPERLEVYSHKLNRVYRVAPVQIHVQRINVGAYDLADSGDSGGPWFDGNTAYGTMRAKITPGTNGVGTDAVYMAVNYVESGLGVTVMTS